MLPSYPTILVYRRFKRIYSESPISNIQTILYWLYNKFITKAISLANQPLGFAHLYGGFDHI